MKQLTHTDKHGKAVMVDVGDKETQLRIAKATGHIILADDTLRLIEENLLRKGDVLTVAQLAGISAAKQTSSLIPLCHNIVIDDVKVDVYADPTGIKITNPMLTKKNRNPNNTVIVFSSLNFFFSKIQPRNPESIINPRKLMK